MSSLFTVRKGETHWVLKWLSGIESALGRQMDNLSLWLESTNPGGSVVVSEYDLLGIAIIHAHL